MKEYIYLIIVFSLGLNNIFYGSDLDKILKFKKEIKLQQTSDEFIGSVRDCVTDNNFIYVVDSKLSNIKVFNLNGKLIHVIGKKGKGPGEFQFPVAIDVDENYIYIADVENRQLNLFDKQTRQFERAFQIIDGRTIKVLSDKILISYLDESNNKSLHSYDYMGNIINSYIDIPQITLDNQMISDLTTFDLDDKNNIYFIHEMQYKVLKGKHDFKQIIINDGDKKYIPPPPKSFEDFYSRKKLASWVDSWSHILKLIVNTKKDKIVLYLSGPEKSGKWLDIYNLKGDLLYKNVKCEYRLIFKDNKNNLYFLDEKFNGNDIEFILRQYEFIK